MKLVHCLLVGNCYFAVTYHQLIGLVSFFLDSHILIIGPRKALCAWEKVCWANALAYSYNAPCLAVPCSTILGPRLFKVYALELCYVPSRFNGNIHGN